MPLGAKLLALFEAVVLGKALDVDGAADDVQVFLGDAEILLEMSTDHQAVHNHQGCLVRQVLAPLQPGEGPVGEVEKFDAAHQTAHELAGMFLEIVLERSGVQAPLGVEDVLTVGLVEADGHIVGLSCERSEASAGEPPGTQKPGTAHGG